MKATRGVALNPDTIPSFTLSSTHIPYDLPVRMI